MLVLSRHVGETLTIGDNIQITILSYDKKGVRLGIDAPKDIEVHRLEIYQRIHPEHKKSPHPSLNGDNIDEK